ncbi:MAG: hypothetical protein KAI15_07735 [Gammaproteobacteria bacterium]|nr:hypothetical protein [Gammaproteobacteria bacterium]
MPDDKIARMGIIDTEKKALFVTGASGFLGTQILESLELGDYSRITLLSRRGLELPK